MPGLIMTSYMRSIGNIITSQGSLIRTQTSIEETLPSGLGLQGGWGEGGGMWRMEQVGREGKVLWSCRVAFWPCLVIRVGGYF